MEKALKTYFGFMRYRPYQKEVIEQILNGKDCLVVMATGSGKSLCYQAPPLISGKTAVVVSPLISLMQDQVMALKQRGISAEYLGSTQTDPTVQVKAESGGYSLLFMTPEKALRIHKSFWMNLLKTGISLLAVDEAHCISEWGHNFRVEYKQLDRFRPILPNVPFVSMTATATERVRSDIIKSLNLKDPYVAIGSFDRKNIFYGVKHFNRGNQFFGVLIQEVSNSVASGGSTIIYCQTIKDVEQIRQLLQSAEIKAGIYHGQMTNESREETHRLFIRDELRVVVATIAFGMGIDKPDIRRVIHYGCPKSLETYYQESGRCGRDGIASVCWLYYTRSDFTKSDFYCSGLETNQRKAVVESMIAAQQYCFATTCRRKSLLEHFGENVPAENCGTCDNCTTIRKERDLAREAFLLMTCVKSCRGSWGLKMPVDVLRGSRTKKIVEAKFNKLPLHGLGKDYSSDWWKSLGSLLVSQGYLKERVSDVYRFVSVSDKGEAYLSSAQPDCQPPLLLPLLDEMCDEAIESSPGQMEGHKSSTPSEYEALSKADAKLYRALLEERMKRARFTRTAPYAICGDVTIKFIALVKPTTRAALANIDGVNQHFVDTHGDHFLQVISNMSQELNLTLEGEMSSQTLPTEEVTGLPDNRGKLSPMKFKAWKMWHDDKLSIHKIANFPGRSAPIKEETVVAYLLDAVREGFEIDWPRFCDEIELTPEMLASIIAAVKKVGSTKLTAIKEELPENISYNIIRIVVRMMRFGISSPNTNEVHLPKPSESSINTPTRRSFDYDQNLAKSVKSEEIDLSLAEQKSDVLSLKHEKAINKEESLSIQWKSQRPLY